MKDTINVYEGLSHTESAKLDYVVKAIRQLVQQGAQMAADILQLKKDIASIKAFIVDYIAKRDAVDADYTAKLAKAMQDLQDAINKDVTDVALATALQEQLDSLKNAVSEADADALGAIALIAPPAVDPAPPAVDPNAPPAVDPNAPPAVDPNAPPAVDPNAPPAVDPNAPPAVDPNAPPAVDPNAPPAVDPNAPPAVDPNAPPADGQTPT